MRRRIKNWVRLRKLHRELALTVRMRETAEKDNLLTIVQVCDEDMHRLALEIGRLCV